MRERVNVPFSFAMMATATKRPRRVHKAASVLRDAAVHLADWPDPPAVSSQGREVFYSYARNLDHHVQRLEVATSRHDAETAADSLEQIRQTCNNCHKYFRPASELSRDVLSDRLSIELGGDQ